MGSPRISNAAVTRRNSSVAVGEEFLSAENNISCVDDGSKNEIEMHEYNLLKNASELQSPPPPI